MKKCLPWILLLCILLCGCSEKQNMATVPTAESTTNQPQQTEPAEQIIYPETQPASPILPPNSATRPTLPTVPEMQTPIVLPTEPTYPEPEEK